MEDRARAVLALMNRRRVAERMMGLAGMALFMGLYVASWAMVL